MRKIISLTIMSILVITSFGAKEKKKVKNVKEGPVTYIEAVSLGYNPGGGITGGIDFGKMCARTTTCKRGPGNCEAGRVLIPCP